MMKLFAIAAITIVAIVAAVLISHRTSPTDSAASTAPLPRSSAAAQRQRPATAGSWSAQWAAIPRPRPIATPRSAVPNATSSDEPLRRSDAELRAAAYERRRAYIAEIDQSFATERVDTSWAFSTAAKVQEAFDVHESLQDVRHQVDCRSATCRLELEDDGSGKLAGSLPLLLNTLAGDLPSAAAQRIESTGSATRVVLYMSRAQVSDAAPKK